MSDWVRDADGIWRFAPGKDPLEILDFAIDFARELAAVGDTLQSAIWSVPVGLGQIAETVSGTVATIKVSGGAADTVYVLSCLATSAGGRTYERSIRVPVRER